MSTERLTLGYMSRPTAPRQCCSLEPLKLQHDLESKASAPIPKLKEYLAAEYEYCCPGWGFRLKVGYGQKTATTIDCGFRRQKGDTQNHLTKHSAF